MPGPVSGPPAAGRALREANLCPRCESPIDGTYKFCPTCACRLRAGDPAPAAPSRPESRGSRIAVGLAAAALLVAVGGAAAVLVRPGLLARPGATPTQRPSIPSDRVLARPYTVDDIPNLLVTLDPGGYAYSVPLEEVPGLSDEDVERAREALRSEGREAGGAATLDALVYYPLRVLRIEITRGQYEEFARDVDEHRDRMPAIWVQGDGVASPNDVDIFDHVPTSWVRRVPDAPAMWGVEPAAKNLPVVDVSYVDALAFCEWASDRLGLPVALPFAMEWVRTARPAGSPRDATSVWPWGTAKLAYACNNLMYWTPNPGAAQIVDFPYPEGGRGAGNGGVLALAGNVREWAAEHSLQTVPRLLGGAPFLTWKETRRSPTALACGGSFRTGIDDCQVDSRAVFRKTERRDDLGFRVVVR